MKKLKIKLYFFGIAIYLYRKLKQSNILLKNSAYEYNRLITYYNQTCSNYELKLKSISELLAKEKEYNLNIRMRRRNQYWRKNTKIRHYETKI